MMQVKRCPKTAIIHTKNYYRLCCSQASTSPGRSSVPHGVLVLRLLNVEIGRQALQDVRDEASHKLLAAAA